MDQQTRLASTSSLSLHVEVSQGLERHGAHTIVQRAVAHLRSQSRRLSHQDIAMLTRCQLGKSQSNDDLCCFSRSEQNSLRTLPGHALSTTMLSGPFVVLQSQHGNRDACKARET